jgi:hypothetical protein
MNINFTKSKIVKVISAFQNCYVKYIAYFIIIVVNYLNVECEDTDLG